jgi:phage gp45-like
MELVPFIYEGQVIFTDDPDQMGRVKVWIPAIDGDSFDGDMLPWAEYASPLAGFTVEFPAGGENVENSSHTSYGFWAIPKMGATVLCFFLGGDSRRRYYFASTFRLHRNRSLPLGRNVDPRGQPGPWGDAGSEDGMSLNRIEPAYTNLREQFQNKMTEPETLTRGLYERQVAQQQFDKDGQEGYSRTPVRNESYLDSQTYCWVTPGRHSIIFQDDPRWSRARIRTASGHQMIMDDANERIYVSTDKGKSWLEMDSDGHVHVYSASSFSVTADQDINFTAGRKINMDAVKGVNINAADGDINITTGKSLHLKVNKDMFTSVCGNFHQVIEGNALLLGEKNLDISVKQDVTVNSNRELDLKSAKGMKLQGSRIDLNGPAARTAQPAQCGNKAETPPIVPDHEPWSRPISRKTRGPNWKK